MKVSIIAVITTLKLFYYSFSSACNSEAPPNCQSCSIWLWQRDKCTLCNPGYYLSNKSCRKRTCSQSDCMMCHPNPYDCLKCQSNRFLVSEKCYLKRCHASSCKTCTYDSVNSKSF